MTEFKPGTTVNIYTVDTETRWDEPVDTHHYQFVSWMPGTGVIVTYRGGKEMFIPLHRIDIMTVVENARADEPVVY